MRGFFVGISVCLAFMVVLAGITFGTQAISSPKLVRASYHSIISWARNNVH